MVLDGGDDLQWLGKPPLAALPAGKIAGGRPDPLYPARFQPSHVLPRRRMLPHHLIHRRGDKNGPVGGQKHGACQRIGEAVRQFRQ